MTKSRRQIIKDTISVVIGRFFYYDRKEDEELPRDSIEEAVKNGEISVDEIVVEFERHIRENFK